MDRKATAQETLIIQKQGYYNFNGKKIDFLALQKLSEENSFLITPDEGKGIIEGLKIPENGSHPKYSVSDQSTVKAVLDMCKNGKKAALLNFASAKNPGGGFLNGAMAQEEALAASSGLYSTLLLHETFYNVNRNCGTMMYTDHAIYSPDVVFFRDSNFELLPTPATASVLTLPAVNMGQVILRGENTEKAKMAMKNRMRLCLAIFAHQKNSDIILGAYGCGVFRNDPKEIALYWKSLLEDEGYGYFFNSVVFAILSMGKGNTFSIFADTFIRQRV